MQSVPGLLQSVSEAAANRSPRELEHALAHLAEQLQAFPAEVVLQLKQSSVRDAFFTAVVNVLQPDAGYERSVQDVALAVLDTVGKPLPLTSRARASLKAAAENAPRSFWS